MSEDNYKNPKELKQPKYDGLDIGIVTFLETITVWIVALFFLVSFLSIFYIAQNS